MMRKHVGAILGFLALVACSGTQSGPFLPNSGSRIALTSSLPTDPSLSDLTAIVGHGSGTAIVAPTARNDGTFAAEVTINIHGAPPNTNFFVRRAFDLSPDGICTGTFLNVATLTTDAGGAGSTHFVREAGAPFVSGVQFDLVIQVYTADLSTILQSGCMIVTVK